MTQFAVLGDGAGVGIEGVMPSSKGMMDKTLHTEVQIMAVILAIKNLLSARAIAMESQLSH